MTGYSRASHASRAGDLALPIAPVLDRERARPVRDIVDLARHGDDDLCSEGVDPAVSTCSERGEQIESAGRAGEGKTGREESEKKEGSRERKLWRRTLAGSQCSHDRRRVLEAFPDAVDAPRLHFTQTREGADLARVALDDRYVAGVEQVCSPQKL